MRKIVGAKIIVELRARMDKDAVDKKCSLSELIQFIRVAASILKSSDHQLSQICKTSIRYQ